MADAPKPKVDFSADGVRNFIIKQGGKVSNVAVVGHFMSFLRHPDKEVREENRKKFKEFMNEVAVVKKDEKDDKIVVLKRKKEKEKINYGDFVELPRLVVFQDKDPLQPSTDSSEPLPVPPVRRSKQAKRSSSEEEVQPAAMVMGPSTEGKIPEYTGPKEQQDVISSKEGERIIDQKRQIQSVRSFADIFDQEVQSQKEEAERLRSPAKMAKKNAEQVASTEPEAETNRQEDILKEDEPAPLISPNSPRNSASCEDLLLPQPGLQSSGTMQSISSEASTSCSTDTVVHWHQLDPLEHQWMMESAKANLAALSNLLKQDIKLAGKKDFITGFVSTWHFFLFLSVETNATWFVRESGTAADGETVWGK
ncbi:ankyrin repeat domain-containing protein SOWAHA-like [Acanthaster planci]|uniref:Ankyrin repeat domain-containing protein SOWAHA-like n=1 Tax=Acanthaster planci TaxID=133434 RepID=A0A8B7XR45_ACAPL|nr:ankyrin repeat domain-containing protein SOWAHA-like [Acanthaster planci]